jgi:hypothetical protein
LGVSFCPGGSSCKAPRCVTFSILIAINTAHHGWETQVCELLAADEGASHYLLRQCHRATMALSRASSSLGASGVSFCPEGSSCTTMWRSVSFYLKCYPIRKMPAEIPRSSGLQMQTTSTLALSRNILNSFNLHRCTANTSAHRYHTQIMTVQAPHLDSARSNFRFRASLQCGSCLAKESTPYTWRGV